MPAMPAGAARRWCIDGGTGRRSTPLAVRLHTRLRRRAGSTLAAGRQRGRPVADPPRARRSRRFPGPVRLAGPAIRRGGARPRAGRLGLRTATATDHPPRSCNGWSGPGRSPPDCRPSAPGRPGPWPRISARCGMADEHARPPCSPAAGSSRGSIGSPNCGAGPGPVVDGVRHRGGPTGRPPWPACSAPWPSTDRTPRWSRCSSGAGRSTRW